MQSNAHIAALDNWRAGLMLAGILLHATSVQEVDNWLFTLIGDISNNFRMGAFFTIAGMLSMMSLRRRGSASWLSQRWFTIGVPTIFGLLIICPFMSALYTWRVERSLIPAMPSISWWHFWFLVALLVYAPITFLAGRLDERHRIFDRLGEWADRTRAPPLLPIVVVGTCCYALALAHRALVDILGPWAAPLHDATLISTYAPLYLAGVLLGGAQDLIARFTRDITAPFVVLFGLMLMMAMARAFVPLDRASLLELQLVTISFCPVAMAALILRTTTSMSRANPLVARFSEAAFTIYVVHYPLILLLDIALDPWGLSPYLTYALTVGVTAWLSYHIHFGIVRRSRIAALLINGRPLNRPRPATA